MGRRVGTTTSFLTPAQLGHRNYDTRYASQTRTHWFTWRHIRFKLEETSNVMRRGWTVLRLDAIAARVTPVPATPTGFLMHAMDAEELADAGGAVAFVTDWLNRDATTRAYKRKEFLWRQGNLFPDEPGPPDTNESPSCDDPH